MKRTDTRAPHRNLVVANAQPCQRGYHVAVRPRRHGMHLMTGCHHLGEQRAHRRPCVAAHLEERLREAVPSPRGHARHATLRAYVRGDALERHYRAVADAVERFMARVPDDVIVVFDEAYYEYVRHPQFPDALGYVKQRRSAIVLRTFSKIYGLAGLRIGYGISTPEVIDYLNRVRPPFNANSLAQKAALAALAAIAYSASVSFALLKLIGAFLPLRVHGREGRQRRCRWGSGRREGLGQTGGVDLHRHQATLVVGFPPIVTPIAGAPARQRTEKRPDVSVRPARLSACRAGAPPREARR